MATIITLLASVALALIIHEFGHLVATRNCKVAASELGLGFGPILFKFTVRGITFSLRAVPLGSFVRLDGTALSDRAVPQQLLVHLGGIIFNLIAGLATYGTIFGWINLLVALGNLLPIYKHDGWKCGLVIMRALVRKKSRPVEWVYTFSGCFASLIVVHQALQALLTK